MVEDAAERIPCFACRVGHGGFDCLADGDTERAGGIGHFGEDFSAGVCLVAWACDAVCAPDLHHSFSEGFLVEADSDHINLTFEAEKGAGKGQRATPLTCAGFSGEAFNAELLIVPGLWHGGIGLVAAGRADAFILVIDFGGSAEVLFEVDGPFEGGWSPAIKDLKYFIGDVYPFLGADFLLDEVHWEDRRQHFGADRFAVRPQRRK